MTRRVVHYDCYVYALLDTRTPEGIYRYGRWVFKHEPFYVGKGRGLRCFTHEHVALSKNPRCNSFKSRLIRKMARANCRLKIRIIRKNLSSVDACGIEIALIARIGRRNLKQGPLVNLTDGGDGKFGYKMPKATRQKISQRLLSDPGTSERLRKWHASLTPEQKFERSRCLSKAIKASYSCSDAAKRISKSVKKHHASATDEQKRTKSRRIRKALRRHFSSCEAREVSRKTQLEYWNSMTKDERRNKAAHLRSISPQAEARRVEKISKSWYARTPEERAAINAKRNAAIKAAKAKNKRRRVGAR